MRAAVLEEFAKPLVVRDVELSEPGPGEVLDVIPRLLITGRRICGSSFGGLKGREDVPALVNRYLAGEIDVDPFISHRISLDDVNVGFQLMEAQDGIRSVIEFT
jgi:S-(hydroxymethyl)glutathione dehydrogenase/alcohol dehydrogenase